MDLPTYTNIWRIEKRLYKLYDFRLPAPLPINWIAVFAGITVPYILFLVAIGLPFNHTLVWLYVLPPGVLTWLTTRPVIESKRLPELIESQIRYLAEPRVWCRMAPLAEKDKIIVTARVWHSNRLPRERTASMAALLERGSLARRKPGVPLRPPRVPAPAASAVASGLTALPGRAAAGVPVEAGTVAAGTAAGSPAGLGVARGAAGAPRRGGAAKEAAMENRAVGRGTAGSGSVKGRPARRGGAAQPAARDAAGGREAAAALTSGQVAPAPPLPTYGATRHPAYLGGALARPSTAPVLSAGHPHVTPAVWPALPASANTNASDAATTAAMSAASAPGTPATYSAAATEYPAVVTPADAEIAGPAVPVRVRGTGPGTARFEVAHDGPARRQAPPAAPADRARAWPSVGMSLPAPAAPAPHAPSEGVPSLATPGTATPGTSPAEAAKKAVAGDPAAASATGRVHGRSAPRQELFSLLAGGSTTESPRPAAPVPATEPVPAEPVPAEAVPAEAVPAEVAGARVVLAEPVPAGAVPATVATAATAETARAGSAPVEPVPFGSAPAGSPPVMSRPAEVVPAEVVRAETAPAVSARTVSAGTVSAGAAVPAVPPTIAAPPEPPQQSRQDTSLPRPAERTEYAERARPVPSVERALSGPSRDRNLTWHTRVKLVAGATQGPGARDQEALDRSRARLPLKGSKLVLMLGCTSGAGQTVTTLMTGQILASLREEPVAAVDLHDGTLSSYTAPAAMLRDVLDGVQPQGQPAAHPDGLHPKARGERQRTMEQARLDVIASDNPLRDGDERRLAEHLGRHYPLTVLDPGATGLTRLLKVTDQLVIVAPASVEAASALADTRDWLDAHGFTELAMHSVTLVNGVSRQSLADVEAAEAVARGRCRAIVRVPWDDLLSVGNAGPSALHPQTRVAYTALAGILVAGMAAAPVRRPQ